MSEDEFSRILEETLEEFDPEWGQAEVAQFQRIPSLVEAIRKAAESTDEEGNVCSHQRKQHNFPKWRVSLERAMEELPAAEDRFKACKSFDDIYNLVWELVSRFTGLKRMYCYDVAFRIGAKQELLPEDKVYIHANPLKAVEVILGRKMDGQYYIHMSDLPKALQIYAAQENLLAWQIENLLCHFYKVYKRNHHKKEATKSNWKLLFS